MTMWAPELEGLDGPLYSRIADAIGRDVGSRRLAPGDRLPTHRDLADRLGVTVGTVSRGYAEAIRRGLLSGEVGRGTFVTAPAPAPRTASGLIDLSVNHPPASAREQQALRQTLLGLAARKDLADLMAYESGPGAMSHRQAGADWIRRAGLDADAESVLVTSGSQHAMTTLFTSFLKPGDRIATEALTYPGLKSLAALLDVRLHGLAMDEGGLLPDAFEAACSRGVRALYCLPTLQNPTTALMPEARRREIAAIARRHGVLIFEDDIHGHLPDEAPPPLVSFAPELGFYMSSTSKSLAPGLRVGFLMAPRTHGDRLAAAIRASVWMAAPLMAEIAAEWIRDGTAAAIVVHRRQEAGARQAIARRVLAGLPLQSHPSANHAWLTLPGQWQADAFVAEARRRGVAVSPAAAFAVGRGGIPEAVRVCLGAVPTHARLEDGLRILADTVAASPDSGLPGL